MLSLFCDNIKQQLEKDSQSWRKAMVDGKKPLLHSRQQLGLEAPNDELLVCPDG